MSRKVKQTLVPANNCKNYPVSPDNAIHYRSILLAGCLGYQGIKTEATGKFAKTAFETVGMLPSSSIKYEDFEFEGRKVFGGMDGENKEITFMKKKFFQSCLNHII